MTRPQKSLLSTAVLLIGSALWLPLWRIDIWAPQYPEGLGMRIFAGSIEGNVSQINILNHYIGMKHIIPEQIPELRVIPVILSCLVGLGIVVILANKTFLAKMWLFILGLFSVGGLIDFYLWGYDYGHNLSPEAPIKIPGLTYQPPLLGYKQILNIEAYSLPDLGTYALSLGILLAVAAIYWEKLPRRLCRHGKFIPLLLALFLGSCTAKKSPIHFGTDHCDNCHMQISDNKYGVELVTQKGRTYKFDSLQCFLHFQKNHSYEAKYILVVDYFHPGRLIDVKRAVFLTGSNTKGPMGPEPIATEDQQKLRKLKTSSQGRILHWKELLSSSL
jgi:copper chaperone NosL